MTTLNVLAFLAILFLPTMLLGGLILAFLQGLGFRFVVKLQKSETPAFSKRLLVQILVMISLIGLGLLAYYFMAQAMEQGFEQAKESPTASLEMLAQIGILTKFLSFGTTKISLILSWIFWAVAEIVFYVLLVACFTKVLTKFNLVDGIKSQTFTIVILILIHTAIIGAGVYALKDMPQFETTAIKADGTTVIINQNVANPASTSNILELNGVWKINAEKSNALCDENEDETVRAICESSVAAAVMATIGSDGMLIQNGILQDGPDICNIAVRNEEGFKYSCINPINRSITARLNLNADKTITMGLGVASLILEKK